MPTTSTARINANRNNALKSTGPKTPEGKSASRLNAFKHGLASEGTLLAASEDPRLVDRRAKAFAREFDAVGEVGELLAHRAAVLSVRMESMAEREMIAVESKMDEARDQFDRDRLDEIEGWIGQLDDIEVFPSALDSLESVPEGVAHLLATWKQLQADIRSDDGPASNQAKTRAALWLGLAVEEVAPLKHGQTNPIEAEIARLRLKADAMTAQVKRINTHRERAALLAGFDPSPEATLARRYEAAAERGMYRAIRAIKDARRAQQVDLATVLPTPPPTTQPAPSSAPLASFRVEASTTAASPPKPPIDPVEPPIPGPETRKKRPDLRKIHKNRR